MRHKVQQIALLAAAFVAALGNPCAAQDPPEIVQFKVDGATGAAQRQVNVFDVIELKNGTIYYVEPSWLKSGRNDRDLRLLSGSVQLTRLGSPGQFGVLVENIERVEFWEKKAHDWIVATLQEKGDLENVRLVLAKLEQEFSTWNSSAIDQLRARVAVQEIRDKFAARGDDPRRLLEILQKMSDLSAEHPDNPSAKGLTVEVYETLAAEAFKDNDLINARRYAGLLSKAAPRSDAAARLAGKFSSKARQFVTEAEKQAEAGRADLALQHIDKAFLLAGSDKQIRATYEELYRKYQLLNIACYDQVVHIDPANARTTLEKMIGRLAFDSLLVTLQSDKRFFQGPLVSKFEVRDLGREAEIALHADAKFSDGQPLTPQDVVDTLDWLKRHPRTANSAWARFIEGAPELQAGPGGPVIKVKLRQHPLPAELFTWPVLCGKELNLNQPQSSFPVLGTGPFVRAAPLATSDSARLVRNRHFQVARPEASRLYEVVFPRYTSAGSGADVNDLEKGDTHMIFDISPLQLVRLQNAANDFTVQPFHNNSVWVLAINHHSDGHPLLQDRMVRRAIYQAIDRQGILDQYFIGNAKRVNHKLITGPFPPQSPAYNTAVTALAHNPAIAKNTLRGADPALLSRPLRLVYPEGQSVVEEAMNWIRRDLEFIGLTIDSRPLPPNAYLQQVTQEREFDLAYYRIDHENALFNLQDLFDPQEIDVAGGRNFMSYDNPDLWAKMLEVTRGATASEIFAAQHQVHHHIHDQVVVVPLWFLESHVVYTTRLRWRDDKGKQRGVVTNPSTVFVRPETWFLEPKRRGE